MEGRVIAEMNGNLLKPCTTEEVSLALQHMGPFKAAGSNGFLAAFYQHNWRTLEMRFVVLLLISLRWDIWTRRLMPPILC